MNLKYTSNFKIFSMCKHQLRCISKVQSKYDFLVVKCVSIIISGIHYTRGVAPGVVRSQVQNQDRANSFGLQRE